MSGFGSPVDLRSSARATFGNRFTAFWIDVALVGLATLPLWLLVTPMAAGPSEAVAFLAYTIYLEGSPSGQTLGKKAMNIRVIDFNGGGPIGYGRAALRYVGRILSGLVGLLGYLWMLWDNEKRTWHDKIATTVVVPTSDYPVAAWPG